MATSLDNCDLSSVTLDLDDIKHIGHPCWEFLDPNPNVRKLFERFNNLFFDGILRDCTKIDWITKMNRYSAGETHLVNQKHNRIHIRLNPNLMVYRLRKEIIETTLHEMIHSYLIEKDMEDENDCVGYENDANDLDDSNKVLDLGNHGVNFCRKMSEINNLAKLNITIFHDFETNGSSKKPVIADTDKRFMWRCRGICKYRAPYFGFIWVNENREPQPIDLMWVDSSICDRHEFERYSETDHPKQWFSEWECITMFNQFVAKEKIRIKSRYIDVNGNLNIVDGSFVIELNDEIPAEFYVNYDTNTQTFTSIQQFFPELYEIHEPNCTVCMICFQAVADRHIIEHLNKCSSLQFSLGNSLDETLPILKVNTSHDD